VYCFLGLVPYGIRRHVDMGFTEELLIRCKTFSKR